jgi:hypothetical protein
MHVFDRIEKAYSDLLMSDHYTKYYLPPLWLHIDTVSQRYV